MLFLGITDWLDGFCARKFKQESLFGKVFDPIADKTLMIGMFATLGYFSICFLMPWPRRINRPWWLCNDAVSLQKRFIPHQSQ